MLGARSCYKLPKIGRSGIRVLAAEALSRCRGVWEPPSACESFLIRLENFPKNTKGILTQIDQDAFPVVPPGILTAQTCRRRSGTD
jgi:hypothetical protein